MLKSLTLKQLKCQIERQLERSTINFGKEDAETRKELRLVDISVFLTKLSMLGGGGMLKYNIAEKKKEWQSGLK